MGDDEQIAPVEQEVRDLSAGLQLVKDEQAYLVVRERVHRNSAFFHFPTTFPPLSAPLSHTTRHTTEADISFAPFLRVLSYGSLRIDKLSSQMVVHCSNRNPSRRLWVEYSLPEELV